MSEPMRPLVKAMIEKERGDSLYEWGCKLFHFDRRKCLQIIHYKTRMVIFLIDVKMADIENAINACEKMNEGEDRFIDIKVLSDPSFMIQVKNSFSGRVELDENGIPVNRKEGHGFGTRSIVAFCEKHNAFYQFVAKDNEFTLYLNF